MVVSTRATGAAATFASPHGSPKSTREIASQETKPRRTCLHGQLQKTKFCMYHLKGICQYGDSCAFAHTVTEIQAMPDLRKTRLCTKENCNDPTCTFAHGEEELRSTDMFFKKTLCIWNEKGKCRNGYQCRFAHGQEELRRCQEAQEGAAQPQVQASTDSVTPNVGRRKGQRSAGGSSRNSPTAPAEPMKILPTGIAAAPGLSPAECPPSMEDDCSTTWSGSGGSGSGENLRAELDRLRESISALSMQCSHIQQHVYGQPDRSPHMVDLLQQSALPLPTYAPTTWCGNADQVNLMNANVAAMLMGPKESGMYAANAASPFALRNFGGASMHTAAPLVGPPGLEDWMGA